MYVQNCLHIHASYAPLSRRIFLMQTCSFMYDYCRNVHHMSNASIRHFNTLSGWPICPTSFIHFDPQIFENYAICVQAHLFIRWGLHDLVYRGRWRFQYSVGSCAAVQWTFRFNGTPSSRPCIISGTKCCLAQWRAFLLCTFWRHVYIAVGKRNAMVFSNYLKTESHHCCLTSRSCLVCCHVVLLIVGVIAWLGVCDSMHILSCRVVSQARRTFCLVFKS